MCGICGFINFKTNLVKNERENLAVAHRMAEKLRHRGPDSWGEWVGRTQQCLLIAVWQVIRR